MARVPHSSDSSESASGKPGIAKVKLTPAMEQLMEAKRAYPDALVFFRMGDFYELFFEDATTAAPILEIALTSRDKNKGPDSVPMCGVPYHAAKAHIKRLTERGYKVAICEQVEDPAKAKGLVRREVIRLVTPGMPLDEEESGRENRYILGLAQGKGSWGLAAVDASTGSFPVAEVPEERLVSEISRFDPAELVVAEGGELSASLEEFLRVRPRVLTRRAAVEFRTDRAERLLREQLGVGSLGGFGIRAGSPVVGAAGALVAYLRDANKDGIAHIRELSPYVPDGGLVLDESSRDNLEIFRSQSDKSERGALVGAIDRTVSSAGARRLRAWLLYPLLNVEEIAARLDAVEEFVRSPAVRAQVREALAAGGDIERIMGRLCRGRASPRDVAVLLSTLDRVPGLRETLGGVKAAALLERARALDDLPRLRERIRQTVVDDPPAVLGEGGVVREGFSKELDEIRRIRTGGKTFIAEMETRERERTGIGSLKIRYNKVFGYYIEITKANLSGVPDDYIRKQTLVNAERFITPELKEYEEKVLSADERIRELELRLFAELCGEIAAAVAPLQALARALGELDVLACFAEQAVRRGYVRPEVHEGGAIEIEGGRHPVVEDALPPGERFVPNDFAVDCDEAQVLLITGPNMAGKSTVMRQAALIVLLAQVGSFVPANRARVGLVDRIFTRVGASDNLARGLSTFMLEMTETAAILRQATSRSLVLMDEIGRGTSTFDGLSIAWAVAEALHDLHGKGVRTLFATHYHEMTELAGAKPRVKNFTMSVKEWNERILFLRKLVPGMASRSYGIHVAQLAGVPEPVLARAREILADLEAGQWESPAQTRHQRSSAKVKAKEAATEQLSLLAAPTDRLLAELRRELEEVDPDQLTPIEALTRIAKWKKRLSEH